ncbi:hypothetical protein FKG94_00760 [Exilibacterium tricleocarpae]|uniref:YCII-related domain-containing protein n=1 Tax=Exilibacterium tricleocarpae TaxID=2591008 RepID=A0A545U9H6_9GAMM|nr:YciI family protein [Exilibacterium tricleocarpae]TQV86120.1 hypothetical protein FKG94_00760 [Exilibacterium tricleocarpae]
MAQFLFVYHGGGKNSPEEAEAAIAAWERWFTEIGSDVIDAGKPVGLSTTVMSDGSVVNNGGSNPVAGYGVFSAKSLDEAISIARGCPLLDDGGSVEIAETFDP